MKAISKASIKVYYDTFTKRLLRDYLLDNTRLSTAIKSCLGLIDFTGKKVLDIGCGIGWSSYEFAKASERVVGIDISNNLIDIAQLLFKKQNLNFRKQDVTENRFLGEKFDIVTMLDVFEHIPQAQRLEFAGFINNILEPSGYIFFSCPSIYHQKWLRENKPSEIQPVDEDIDARVLMDFAGKMKGDVVYYAYESIWNSNDYFHAIIQKKPIFFKRTSKKVKLETLKERFARVSSSNGHSEFLSDMELKNLRRRQRRQSINRWKASVRQILDRIK